MVKPNAPKALPDDHAMGHARALSRYADAMLAAAPDLIAPGELGAAFCAGEMQAFLDAVPTNDGQALTRALRVLRKKVMLRILIRDLAGTADFDEVVATISMLADIAIAAVVKHLSDSLCGQFGVPHGRDSGKPQQLHVVAMGKLGGCELNVSSDIDLIFVYPEEGETRGQRPISNHEFFIRLGRRAIALLSELTADGYVFRVDMRLRPFGAEGPLACSFDMLENYFITQGREWERYAWIKARCVTGDRAPELSALSMPFVYRRHLDYSAFDSLRDLHLQVRREVERRDIFDNIKLGPGGIREIEFITQVAQLIRGGREPALRSTSTMTVLPQLAAHGFLTAAAVNELAEAYVFLRNLEHRLQYLDDQQTQMLPGSEEDQQRIAAAMDCADYGALRSKIEMHRSRVTRCFDDLFAPAEEQSHPLLPLWCGGEEGARIGLLGNLGYRDPASALAAINAFRGGSRVRQMPEASHARMQRLAPLVIEAAAGQSDPDATLKRMISLLESVSRREAYLALLLQYPRALSRAAQLLNGSPWAAEYLTSHPILLDELLDTTTLHAAPERPLAEATLRAATENAGTDVERQMDALRHFKHTQTIRLIAQDLAGQLTVEKLSDYLSELADVILAETLRIVWRGLNTRHREQPLFAVIAYGKLGGKELGYASDLDLIFLHRDDAPDAPENYARLAQRLNRWLTSMTPAGLLYETDLRLRPDGAGGLLVSSLEAFELYQREKAWVWEHQALTRARWVTGDADIGRGFEQIREQVLKQPRNLSQLAREVVEMREKMLEAHPNASELFDIKHDRGGLIDVEFIVQYLVLGYAHRFPELTGNIGNLALLKLAGALGLIPSAQAMAANDAYRRLRHLQHELRLKGEKYARVDPRSLQRETAAVKQVWSTVFGPPCPGSLSGS